MAVIILFLAYLSGSFTLRRFFPEASGGFYDLYPAFGFWMLLIAIIVFKAIRGKDGGRGDMPLDIFNWMLAVLALHFFLALSFYWTTAWDDSYGASIISRTLIVPYMLMTGAEVFRVSSSKNTRLLLLLIAVAGIGFSLAGLIQGMGEGNRLAAFGGGPNIFARVVGSALLVSIFIYLRERAWWQLAPVPGLAACLLLSGSRGGWIAVAIAAIYLLVILWVKLKPHWTKVAFVGFLVVFGMVAGLVVYWDAVFQRTVVVNYQDQYSAGRVEMLETGMEAFRSSPVWGIGLGGYSAVAPVIVSKYGPEWDGKPDYPHNLVVDVAATGGLVGLALLALTGLLFWRAARERSPTLLSHLFLALAILHLSGQMFSGTFYDGRWIWLFMLLYLLSGERKEEVTLDREATDRT